MAARDFTSETKNKNAKQTSEGANMKLNQYILACTMFAAAMMAVAPSAKSQVQTTGTPGSPSATTTIDGKQLPPPDPQFGGVIKDTAADSKPYWPPTVVPPKGAPNVLLIMTDDQGYGVYQHVWRRHPDTGARPDREGRIALHTISLDRALLTHARGTHYRS